MYEYIAVKEITKLLTDLVRLCLFRDCRQRSA